jgi:hypothetical protein
MNITTNLHDRRTDGFVLPLVLVAMVIIIILAIGSMMTNYSSRLQGVRTKAETEAMLAAEAGYERAIFWMSQQSDILGELQAGGGSGNIDFGTGRCSYEVQFQDYIGARPVFHILSTGISGRPSFTRVVDVAVMQETSGWAMGACKVPYSPGYTYWVQFATGEIVDIPVHINNLNDSPDERDIYIPGTHPRFLRKVEMGESRKRTTGYDKYTNPTNVMPCFEAGISFDQPGIRITDVAAVQSKLNRFRDSTDPIYRFTPNGDANIPNPPLISNTYSETTKLSAVQLEFYVEGGVGKVRITNNCTVLGYRRKSTVTTGDQDKTWDYKLDGGTFPKYYIYAYHYGPNDVGCPAGQKCPPIVVPIEYTYVTQHFGGYTSEPGGQIYVNGNVVIGGDSSTGADPNQVVKGKLTVVASGNIWIADSIRVDGPHEYSRDPNGIPTEDNPNVLGLIAQGVIKVIDPGMSNYPYSGSDTTNRYPGPPPSANGYTVSDVNGSSCLKHTYKPVGNSASSTICNRKLPNPTIVEAAITVGGGGWGAENVVRRYSSTNYGGRKEFTSQTGPMDFLSVHGSITEVVRGVVGYPAYVDGYLKNYYIDTRLMSGILPGDIWFSGKYIPAPAGWHDRSIRD